ncbi:MAG: DJ-1/PfpI family protein [Clostridium sp.]|nr:DJ-1/PfpI family protein [Clostridium sp.]MCM1546864.1 DJ-1/PfpI family protein [Ruminococcus sp.]
MIYVFLANGFEEVEALTPVDMLRRCELEVMTVGVGGKNIKGSHGITVAADIDTSEIKLDNDLDMIVLPGGMPGTLNLEKSADVQGAIDFCVGSNKYVAAICAAPSILGHKGLLEGKKATCYTGFEGELFGAEISGDPVCTDGNIVTSRGAGTAMEFSFELVKNLVSEERAEILKNSVIYSK